MQSNKRLLTAILISMSTLCFSQVRKSPLMTGMLPVINGTRWAMFSIYATGANPTSAKGAASVYQFCKANRWEIVPQSGIGPTGNYKIQGNKLLLTYRYSHQTARYTMSWNAADKILKLDNGSIIMLLKYNGVTDCN